MLALNFDGGTFWDAVMRFASGIPNWIPLYVIVLFIIYCKGGWKYMLFLLIAVGLGVGICDQICNFFKANVDYLRPVHVKELVSDLHVLTGPRINLNGTVSGHASTSFCVFLLTALAMRKGWFTAIMLLFYVFMLLAAVRCLYLDRGWRRNVLALILGLLVGALLLWLGGGWVLSRFGLAWRAWLASLLLGAALVLAVLAAAFTVCSLVHRRHHLAEALLVDASALVFLMVIMVLGPFLWGASLRAERVVVWQGQTLLEEERGFPRQGVDYYDYRGPLVRGTSSQLLLGLPEDGPPEAD